MLATRLKPIGPNIVFDDDAPLRDARERRAFAACNYVVERSGRDADLPCSGRNGLIISSHCLRSRAGDGLHGLRSKNLERKKVNAAESYLDLTQVFRSGFFQVFRPRFFGFCRSAGLPPYAGFAARRAQRPVGDGAAEMRVGGFDVGVTVSRLMALKIFDSGVERRQRRRLFPDGVPRRRCPSRLQEPLESPLAGFPPSGASL